MSRPPRTPSLYSLPGLPIGTPSRSRTPRDSWMCPCTPSIGVYFEMASRVAVLPTGIM